MTYLFVKAEQHLACELSGGAHHALRFTIGPRFELTEGFPCASALHERWVEVRKVLEHDGWCGPLGKHPSGQR